MPPTKKRILCVDDHSDNCELISIILKDYEVTSAYSMADAIMHATAERFDLYILDYHLPDGTGLELCLMLRAFDRDTPILFATASSNLTESQVVIVGAQGLVKSGISLADNLTQRVSQLLKQ